MVDIGQRKKTRRNAIDVGDFISFPNARFGGR
jgi:hypothetical protein